MHLDVIRLKQKIDRLEELFYQIIEGLSKESIDNEVVAKYKQLKKEILLSLFEAPVHKTESKHFADVRKTLQRLTLSGDPFLPERDEVEVEFKEVTSALYKDLDIELAQEEYDDLGQEYFYSWFSGEAYAEALLKSQLLILRSERLPEELNHFADEIRSCYAFQNYTAAYALCRTLFEIAVRDLFVSNGLHVNGSKYSEYTWQYLRDKNKKGNKITTIDDFDPKLFDRIEILLMLPKFAHFNNEMHEVRELGNSIVHANRRGTKKTATKMIQLTFQTIHNLYEEN